MTAIAVMGWIFLVLLSFIFPRVILAIISWYCWSRLGNSDTNIGGLFFCGVIVGLLADCAALYRTKWDDVH